MLPGLWAAGHLRLLPCTGVLPHSSSLQHNLSFKPQEARTFSKRQRMPHHNRTCMKDVHCLYMLTRPCTLLQEIFALPACVYRWAL